MDRKPSFTQGLALRLGGLRSVDYLHRRAHWNRPQLCEVDIVQPHATVRDTGSRRADRRVRAEGAVDGHNCILWATKSNSAFILAFADLSDTVLGEVDLGRSVGAIREHIRSGDLIVRYGRNSFPCGLPGMNLPEAQRRFDQSNTQSS